MERHKWAHEDTGYWESSLALAPRRSMAFFADKYLLLINNGGFMCSRVLSVLFVASLLSVWTPSAVAGDKTLASPSSSITSSSTEASKDPTDVPKRQKRNHGNSSFQINFLPSARKLINANLRMACSLLESRGGSARIEMAADHLQKLILLSREIRAEDLDGRLSLLLKEFKDELAQLQEELRENNGSYVYSLEDDGKFLETLDKKKYDPKLWDLLTHYFERDAVSIGVAGASVGASFFAGGEVGLFAGGGKSVLGKKYAAFGVRRVGSIGGFGPTATVGGYKIKLKKGEKSLRGTHNGDNGVQKGESVAMGGGLGIRVTKTSGKMKGGEVGVGGFELPLGTMGGIRVFKKGLPFRDYKMLRTRLGIGLVTAKDLRDFDDVIKS